MNALQLCRWQFSHKKNFKLSSSKMRFYTEIGYFAFLSPPLGELRATYDDHLRLIGKCIVDFLLVLIEPFFASCYVWGATSEYWYTIGDFAPTGAGWRKILGRRGRLPPNTSSQKTKLNVISYGIKIWTDLFFSFVTIHASDRQTDRQTDGQTELSSLDRVCIPCSTVKTCAHVYVDRSILPHYKDIANNTEEPADNSWLPGMLHCTVNTRMTQSNYITYA